MHHIIHMILVLTDLVGALVHNQKWNTINRFVLCSLHQYSTHQFTRRSMPSTQHGL